MSGWDPAPPARVSRAAQRRQREIARAIKEREKLDALGAARLEVEHHENAIDVLTSIHREVGTEWNWCEVSAALVPPPPVKSRTHEIRAAQSALILALPLLRTADDLIGEGTRRDEEVFSQLTERYQRARAFIIGRASLARRILAGEVQAYYDAIRDVSPLGEMETLGSEIVVRVHSRERLAVELTVDGPAVIPSEAKTLTSTGKVSTKPMARSRSHEIYQDFVCGCILRVARELFALLPIREVLVTAAAKMVERGDPVPVLSAIFDRPRLSALNFETADASDTIEMFVHRGDFKATRRSGAFEPIFPLTFADETSARNAGVDALRTRIEAMRKVLSSSVSTTSRATK